ncbi:calcium-binding protein [Jannaschia donghaensis]|nr:calcium-binding protein [Jannaschia donghaensis]
MVALPMGDEDDETDPLTEETERPPEADTPSGDLLDGELDDTARTEASIDRHDMGDDPISSLVPADDRATTSADEVPAASDATRPEDHGDRSDLPVRDQIGGDHLTDRIVDTSAAPVALPNDAILGNDDADRIEGTGSSDLMIGNGGDDTLSGLAGRDVLMGGDGDDSVSGGGDDDMLHGDAGNDRLTGDDGDDLISGGDGDDTLTGGNGADRLIGGEGRDIGVGGEGDDLLDGTVMDDGGQDRDDGDSLIGGMGDDTLAGGAADTLVGGDGSDLFLFRAPSAAAYQANTQAYDISVIEDFDPTEDAIEIDYSGQDVPQLGIFERDGGTDIALDGVTVIRLADSTGIEPTDILLIRQA